MRRKYLIDTAPIHVRCGVLSGRIVDLMVFSFVGVLTLFLVLKTDKVLDIGGGNER